MHTYMHAFAKHQQIVNESEALSHGD